MSKKVEQVGYLEVKGKFLVVKKDGTSELLTSRKELTDYLVKNNYKIVK